MQLALPLGGELPLPPAPFVQTSFGEVLAARVAGTAPRGSPFCSADGESCRATTSAGPQAALG